MTVAASPTDAADAPLAELIRTVVEPLVAKDRGTIEWIGVDGGIAKIRLGGACAGCPGQHYTITSVILPLLQRIAPSITAVKVSVAV